jgi:hypothetical protein
MPVPSDMWNRVVTAPARDRLYNIPDSELKDFAVLLYNYFHEKTQ